MPIPRPTPSPTFRVSLLPLFVVPLFGVDAGVGELEGFADDTSEPEGDFVNIADFEVTVDVDVVGCDEVIGDIDADEEDIVNVFVEVSMLDAD